MNLYVYLFPLIVNIFASEVNIIKKPGELEIVFYLPLCLDKGLTIDSLVIIEYINYMLSILSDQLPFTSLGYVIYDSCGGSDVFLRMAIEDAFHPRKFDDNRCNDCKLNRSMNGYMLTAISSLPKHHTSFLAKVFSVERKKLISLSQDSPDLDAEKFKNYIRMNSGNLKAFNFYKIVIEHFKWKGVGLILSSQSYGEVGNVGASKYFRNAAFCVTFTEYFGANSTDMIRRLKEYKFADVFILWLTVDESMRFLRLADEHQIYNKTWIASPLLSEIPTDSFNKFNPLLVQGMVMIKLKNQFSELIDPSMEGFYSKFWTLSTSDIATTWWQGSVDMTMLRQNISLKSMKENVSLETYAIIDRIHKAVFTIQFDVLSAHEKHVQTEKIVNELKNKTLVNNLVFQIMSLTDLAQILLLQTNRKPIKSVLVGQINVINEEFERFENALWAAYKNATCSSACHDNCTAGFHPIYVARKCCWICEACSTGYYKQEHGNSICQKCPPNSESSKNKTKCVWYRNVYPSYSSQSSYIVYIFIAIGVSIWTVFFVSFIKYRDTAVVRAANAPLSFTQLITHVLLFIYPLTSLGKLQNKTCLTVIGFQGMLVTIIQGIIFSKTIFLVKVFRSKRVANRSSMIGHQYIWIFAAMAIYTGIFAIIVYDSPNGIKCVKNKRTLVNDIFCDNENIFIFQLVYTLILSFLCMAQAFRAKNLPSHFNEAKYIFYSAFGTFTILTMSPLLYASLKNTTAKLMVRHAVIFLINITNLICMFGTKVWVIMFRPERNNSGLFKKAVYSNTARRVDQTLSRRNTNAMSLSSLK